LLWALNHLDWGFPAWGVPAQWPIEVSQSWPNAQVRGKVDGGFSQRGGQTVGPSVVTVVGFNGEAIK